jgi:hypothetical protein
MRSNMSTDQGVLTPGTDNNIYVSAYERVKEEGVHRTCRRNGSDMYWTGCAYAKCSPRMMTRVVQDESDVCNMY